jgi:tRNA-splicing ligase RtcB
LITIDGKFCDAIVFAQKLENTAREQIKRLCDQEFVQGAKIRIMPDVHAGAGCTIGTTMTISNKVVPNLVGVDIGCGMETVILEEDDINLKKLDALIHRQIPAGPKIRSRPHALAKHLRLDKLRAAARLDLDRASKSVGTLGGGNHFIELGRDEHGRLHLVVHSGSRHLGAQLARHYQIEAQRQIKGNLERVRRELRELERKNSLMANKKQERLSESIAKPSSPPADLAYLSDRLFDDYLHDMRIVQNFALQNRKAIVDEIVSGLDLRVIDAFSTIHNYIDLDAMILRKGAVSAKAGERLLIPMNMRDGSIVCMGKGNAEWNYSAPHGAGRLMSRTEARKKIKLDAFKEQMRGIYSSCVNNDTLDESPMAYKAMDEIIGQIQDSVNILYPIKPIYNFKAKD